MKTLQVRVRQAAKDSRVNQLVVERDYVQSYVLLGIGSQPELRDALIFKGGTALKKVHLGDYRFSEDRRSRPGGAARRLQLSIGWRKVGNSRPCVGA